MVALSRDIHPADIVKWTMSRFSIFTKLEGFRVFLAQNPRLILIKQETNTEIYYKIYNKSRHERR